MFLCFFLGPLVGGQENLVVEKLRFREEIHCFGTNWHFPGPTIRNKKVSIPTFHARGHCGLRFGHYIDLRPCNYPRRRESDLAPKFLPVEAPALVALLATRLATLSQSDSPSDSPSVMLSDSPSDPVCNLLCA